MISYTSDASNGIEDPRIVKIEDVYYTTYSGINALGALATSLDLITFERKGIIVPKFTFDEFKILAECNNLLNAKYFRHVRHFDPCEKAYLWDKYFLFFPRKIGGKLAFFHRIRPRISWLWLIV